MEGILNDEMSNPHHLELTIENNGVLEQLDISNESKFIYLSF